MKVVLLMQICCWSTNTWGCSCGCSGRRCRGGGGCRRSLGRQGPRIRIWNWQEIPVLWMWPLFGCLSVFYTTLFSENLAFCCFTCSKIRLETYSGSVPSCGIFWGKDNNHLLGCGSESGGGSVVATKPRQKGFVKSVWPPWKINIKQKLWKQKSSSLGRRLTVALCKFGLTLICFSLQGGFGNAVQRQPTQFSSSALADLWVLAGPIDLWHRALLESCRQTDGVRTLDPAS